MAVAHALRHHGAPFDNEVYEPLAGVLHLAAWRARAREAGLGPGIVNVLANNVSGLAAALLGFGLAGRFG